MEVIQTHRTIADYCDSLRRRTLVINRDYQRQPGVWPSPAQSFFIESILRGFPIPKISLFAKTDRASRKTVREIVDGQQRTLAIKTFFDGRLRLSRTLDLDRAAGRTYDQLDDDLKDRFLTYSLNIDEFVATSREEIREVFRRINSYVVALNAEEHRHANWQGDFKWYVYHLSKELDQQLHKVGVFTERQLVRMQDMKLFAELTHALIHGVTTTTKPKLDRLYREHDSTFDCAKLYNSWIHEACDRLFEMPGLWNTSLVRPYSCYSFLLAAIHAVHDVPTLRRSLGDGSIPLASADTIQIRLLDLLGPVEDKDDEGVYRDFVKATVSKTNVETHRVARARVFVDALRSDGGETFGAQSLR